MPPQPRRKPKDLADLAEREPAALKNVTPPPQSPQGQPKGTPYKRTPEVEKRLLYALGIGATIRLACGYAGIHEETLRRWTSDDADFAERVAHAREKAGGYYLTMIEAAVRAGDWRAAAWKLERMFPSEYGKRWELSDDPGAEQVARGLDASRLAEAVAGDPGANRALHVLMGRIDFGAVVSRGPGDSPQPGAVEAGAAPAAPQRAPRRRRAGPPKAAGGEPPG